MEPMSLGVVGTGSVVREIYQYLYFRSRYAPLVRVEAICDVDRRSLREFGTAWSIPESRWYTDYRTMFERERLEVVAVNTPDSLHRDPVLAALEAGCDVVLPKPTSDRVVDVHVMIGAMKAAGRFLGVDFHKREDPITKEARARYISGVYGRLQSSFWYMLDKLLVADPNREPRFFASADFAEKNTPVSFLTSHMSDTFMTITNLKPLEVRATGYRQKLPSLRPLAVNGYDLVDTEVLFEGGCVAHFLTGWALPNTANCLTVQSAKMIFTDATVDLWETRYGYHEVTHQGIDDRNILFRNFEADGTVSGFGMGSPGRILENIRRFRDGAIGAAEMEGLTSPFAMGLYTTLVCEGAHESLSTGVDVAEGVVRGAPVDCQALLRREVGAAAAGEYYRA